MRTSKAETPSYESVWQILQETNRILQENAIQRQETERVIKEYRQETDRILRESSEKTDKKIRELTELFNGQWGKLVEALLGPGCLSLFRRRGIDVSQTYGNALVQRGGRQMEIDVLLVNDTELVVVEIKSTSTTKYIDKLLQDLGEFKYFFPQYKGYKVYGAIAALRYYGESEKYAIRKGLFVLKSSGENLIRIENELKFKPKSF